MKRTSLYALQRLLATACLALLCGCMTNLERADKRFTEKRYDEAARLYLREYATQRQSASLPQWKAKQYRYEFDTSKTVAGLLGAIRCADALGQEDEAKLLRVRLSRFCERHSLPMDWTSSIGGLTGER